MLCDVKRLVLVLALAGCGPDPEADDGTRPPTTPASTCRAIGAACAVTADCCGQNICVSNRCASAPTTSPTGPEVSHTWAFEHACPRSGTISVRLFDVTNRIIYPSRQNVWFLPPGRTQTATIQCPLNARICYGADSSDGMSFWGIGVNGTEDCDDCCGPCGTTPPVTELVCD